MIIRFLSRTTRALPAALLILALYSSTAPGLTGSTSINDTLDILDLYYLLPADTIQLFRTGEVVVTGTRTERRIIDIPYSVERIDQTQFRFDRRVSVNDVLRTVPGLFLQSRYGNHDVRISIRGFGSRSNTGIRGVRILLDGIPESEPDGQTRIEAIDFNSVGSIEIVKGNALSLYTNAPGGVINFINDIKFLNSFAIAYNESGSFGLRRSGIKTGVRTPHYGLLTTYTYHSSKGFREHSEDHWHILNTVLETMPGDDSRLRLYGYAVDGLIRLPGSLTRAQFAADPFQPNARDVGRDAKRITKKGRLGLQFGTLFGAKKQNKIEVTSYGTIKYFERTAATYRVINRTGLGATVRFVNHSTLFGRANEFSLGTDLLHQTGPVEQYENIGGKKGDRLVLSGGRPGTDLVDQTIGNVGFYFQNSHDLLDDRLSFLVTGRYDKVVFDYLSKTAEFASAKRRFEAFTPKAALNFKFSPRFAVFTSYGLSFDTPAGNEMDNYPLSENPAALLNPDLKPQRSRNFELGVKGDVVLPGWRFMRALSFDATFFNSIIADEIVPFEVVGEVYFRNAAKTNRTGLELGGNILITDGLQWKTAYTFSAFKYRSYTARTIGDTITDRTFDGNVVPSVPRHNLSTSLSYEHRIAPRLTGFVKGHYINVAGLYVDDENSERTNRYQLVNSTLGLDLLVGKINFLFSAGLNNIFNKRYAAFININSTRKEFYEAGEPRNFYAGLRMGYTF